MAPLDMCGVLARRCIGKAQKRQYNQECKPPNLKVGERIFLFKRTEKAGEARNFALPFHGPFRVLELSSSTATCSIRRLDKPQEPILVALERLQQCPDQIADKYCHPIRSPSLLPSRDYTNVQMCYNRYNFSGSKKLHSQSYGQKIVNACPSMPCSSVLNKKAVSFVLLMAG